MAYEFKEDWLKERFTKVVAGEGYSHVAAIVAEWHPKYMQDTLAYHNMLSEYEADQRG